MTKASRERGKRGERQFAKELQDRGLVARRGQQFRGGPDSPDVICESLPDLHFEVKNREQHRPWDWMAESCCDMGPGQIPVVAMKRNRKPWLVVMRLDDFVEMAKDAAGT